MICSSRIAKTSRTCQQMGKRLFPCADGSVKLYDLSDLARDGLPARATSEQDVKGEEETVFEENGKHFGSMSSVFTLRHHEIPERNNFIQSFHLHASMT